MEGNQGGESRDSKNLQDRSTNALHRDYVDPDSNKPTVKKLL